MAAPHHPIPSHPLFKDLTGKDFDRWHVEGYAGRRRWNCRCRCGREKAVLGYDLTAGTSTSCGCLRTEQIVARTTRHGRSGTPEYRAWLDMHRRCADPTHGEYKNYGSRGISICNRWRGENGLINFVQDMGLRPSKKHSVDRERNDGDYEPDNCRWATRPQQSRNSRRTHLLTFRGETMCLTDWAIRVGLTYAALSNRINTYGWQIERALTTPPLYVRGDRR